MTGDGDLDARWDALRMAIGVVLNGINVLGRSPNENPLRHPNASCVNPVPRA